MKRYLDTLILGLSLFFFAFGSYLVWERLSPLDLVYASSTTVADPTPSRISIPSVSIELPVHSAQIVGSKWGLTSEGVSYLSTSPLPGEQGNTVMYGHNWGNLLGELKHISVGDEILVTSQDGTVLHYVVYFVSVVTPDETHIYGNTSDHRLTLYTCTGFLDSKRLVVTAILKN